MTPFGERLRNLRSERDITLKQMSQAVGVSAAYLSALEHGRKGRPSWYLIQRIIAFFNIIWDDAEELVKLANISHPRIAIDTAGLSPQATALANQLAENVRELKPAELARIADILAEAQTRAKARREKKPRG
jgi:transcriptional regulator with XRE-family HTH domain